MNSSFKTHQIVLTPLSPIHIGCGEDFEPTNFVVDDVKKILYCMDPSQANLNSSQLNELLSHSRGDALAPIYKFYEKHIDLYKPWAKAIVPIDDAVKANINIVVSGKRIRDAATARTAYRYIDNYDEAYIPGSSVKGTIHTALLDRINNGKHQESGNNLDRSILQGIMNESPMRLISVSDLGRTRASIYTRAVFAHRIYKKDFQESGLKQSIEVIDQAQYRAFSGSITVRNTQEYKGQPRREVSYTSIKEIVNDLNRYSRSLFNEELKFWKNNSDWHNSVRQLLLALKDNFDAGKIALVRLGKNSGAESKTLHGDRLPRIYNRQKKKTQQSSLTTFVGKYENSYHPFGWALLEVDPQADNSVLKNWCIETHQQSSLVKFDLEAIQKDFVEEKENIQKQQILKAKEKSEEEAKRRAEEQAEKDKEAVLSAMPENQRLVIELCEKLEKCPTTIKPGTELQRKTMELLNSASNWNNDDQRFFAQKLRPIAKKKDMYTGKVGKELKKILATFEGNA